MSTTLHEQQGLRIWKNARNGFVVCRLHFTADARKRSPEWEAAARQGMSEAKFRQEFHIDYGAHLGEKVFPEILSRREEIVCREGPYEFNQWPKSLAMWAGFDYGSKNPSSMHVYTIVDGVTYALWELYQPCKNIIEFIRAMKECPYWDQLRYIVHDPDMQNLKMRDMQSGAMTTVRSQFEQLGVHKWLAGNNNEQAWLVQMQKHWCGPEISFKILECCPRMINEFESATYVSMTEKQLETSNSREAIVDKNNHAMDDCKYFMNSQPKARELTRPTRGSLVSSFGWGNTAAGMQRPQRVIGARVIGGHNYV
jgi:hypothetical protein